MLLYGEAARSVPEISNARVLEGDGKESVSCKSYLWPFPFPLPLPLPLPAPFPKPLTDPFSEPWSEPFSDPFSEPLGVNFSFAFVFARDVEWRAIGKLIFTFTLTWWGSNGVCKRREVVIVLLGGIVREGLLSGSAAAFGG